MFDWKVLPTRPEDRNTDGDTRTGGRGPLSGHQLTYEVAPPAEVLEPPQLLLWKLRLRLPGRCVEALLSAEQPVRSRVHDGKLEQVQRGP